MCYSVVSMISQGTEPTTCADTIAMNNSSPLTNTNTSGYSSYSSPADSPEASPTYDQLLDMDLGYDTTCASMQTSYSMPTTVPHPDSPHSYGSGSPGYCHQHFNPNSQNLMYSGSPQCPPHYNAGGSYSPAYGVHGSNFSYFNYPQGVEGLSPNSQNLGIQQICKICGDTASGNHFGVQSCEACKSFFRRSVRATARYACRGSRNCAIEKNTRNRCQYCRLQKCTANGMRKEGKLS